jgi:putative endonuclease
MRPGSPKAVRAERGGKARQTGREGEQIAALWLMCRGWRILGFRLRTPQGEIDLLAVVEVKSRASLEAALASVQPAQQARLRRAGEALAARRPGLAGLSVRLDMVALAPGRWPRHIPDAWARTGGDSAGARGGRGR